MITNELLIRTVSAAKHARENGFKNTADAFDEIAENLLELMNSGSATSFDGTRARPSEIEHIG
ncbi:hypothetical protein AAFO92_22275 [Roseovarius sp. CAU 1744]|uniref:hypothetical protein n=1 Tax=Roseovarius sp. CAU 1744 TaxID=3140368 RepID=UPI00325AEEF3